MNKTLLPQAKAWVEAALLVERVSGPLVLASSTQPKWTGVPGRNSSGKRAIGNVDMLLVFTARPLYGKSHCAGGSCTVATGVGVEFDEYGRTTVAKGTQSHDVLRLLPRGRACRASPSRPSGGRTYTRVFRSES